jgi:hypothetical protein
MNMEGIFVCTLSAFARNIVVAECIAYWSSVC